jgi:Fe-Mn family superoxide dismutase
MLISYIMDKIFLEPIKIDSTAYKPYIGDKQTQVHYNGHYMKYINNFNKLLENNSKLKKIYCELKKTIGDNSFKNSLLLLIVELFDTNSDIVHNSAQIYNHELYWKTIISSDKSIPMLCNIKNKLFPTHDLFTDFYNKFINEGIKHFGSGWLWIILTNGKLDIITTHDAVIPYTLQIIGVIDIWEHAYYLDYESERKKYLENIFKMINWEKIYKKINKINLKK